MILIKNPKKCAHKPGIKNSLKKHRRKNLQFDNKKMFKTDIKT